MSADRCRIRGHVTFELFEADGTLADRWEVDNFLTELGEAYLAAREGQSAPTRMSHLAIGTGTGQSRTSTALASQVARVALDTGYPAQGTSGDDNDVIYIATFAAGTGTGTITEFAVFNDSTTGTMLNYASGFVREKGASQSLVVTMRMTLGDS